jgi:ubiquitin-conjugating enzyme E2 O
VSWLDTGNREILSETALELVDRTFQSGDFCKRNIEDIRSGVIANIEVKAKLVHAISEEPVEGWKTLADIEGAAEVFLGDYVSCDDWIGQVRFLGSPLLRPLIADHSGRRRALCYTSCLITISTPSQMFDECLVRAKSGQLIRLPEAHNRLVAGDKGDVSSKDIMTQWLQSELGLRISCLRHLMGFSVFSCHAQTQKTRSSLLITPSMLLHG